MLPFAGRTRQQIQGEHSRTGEGWESADFNADEHAFARHYEQRTR
jgi:hypothetical protein